MRDFHPGTFGIRCLTAVEYNNERNGKKLVKEMLKFEKYCLCKCK